MNTIMRRETKRVPEWQNSCLGALAKPVSNSVPLVPGSQSQALSANFWHGFANNSSEHIITHHVQLQKRYLQAGGSVAPQIDPLLGPGL